MDLRKYWICSGGVLVCSSSQAILRLVNSRSKPDGRDITNLRRPKLLVCCGGVVCCVSYCVCVVCSEVKGSGCMDWECGSVEACLPYVL